MKKIFLLFLLTLIVTAHTYSQNNIEKAIEYRNINELSKSGGLLNKTVFGFLPYWEYTPSTVQNLEYDLLSHIAIFSFEADSLGNLTNPFNWPWTDVLATGRSKGIKLLMTVTSFNGEHIHQLMTDSITREKLFSNILQTMVQYNLDGVVIDFENLLNGNDKKFATISFMQNLRNHLSVINRVFEISFATPSYGFGEWNFIGLAEKCDYLFVMNYDYWGSWASTTGPSAPLTGQFLSVTNSIREEYKNVPRDKIILGVPYYGNHWKTKSEQPYASVKPFNADSTNNDWQKIVLYRDVVPHLLQYEKMWDSVSQTPWIRWNDNGWNQVWYDDSTSLELKYDFAISQNLKGIGIWALGYDGERNELWNLIKKKFVISSSLEMEREIPNAFLLFQNYPNPFNSSTVISYQLKVYSKVKLKVFDILGREVAVLENGYKEPGNYNCELRIENGELSSGIYFYTIQISTFIKGKEEVFSDTKNMIYLK